MRMIRLFGALCAALILAVSPVRAAEQSSYVLPAAGPMSMATFVGTYLNPGLRAIATCHNGASAPANGPSGAAAAWQCWIDTTTNPALYKITDDGTNWITLGEIDTTSHVWSPYFATIENGAATLTLPTSTDTLVGRDTTDTLTNKTLTSPAIATPTGIVKGDVGLGNVDNTSDATKNAASVTLTNKTIDTASNTVKVNGNTLDAAAGTATVTVPNATTTLVGRDTTDTLTNKTLTSPAIATPTGIVKGDVGLGNVDNTSDATKNAASVTLTNKTIDTASNTVKVNGNTLDAAAGTATVTVPNATTTLVGRDTTDTLTNKTLTSPAITTPTGIVKGDVGLGNVDNTSDATKNAASVTLTNKTLAAPIVTGLMDRQGATKDSTQSTPAQITADQNNYNPSSVVCATSSTLIINSDAARNITGIGGGGAGCDLFLFNNGSFAITFKDGSASSADANKLDFGADFVLASKAAAHFKYDGSASRWRNVTGSGAGGGSGTVTSVVCGGVTITTSGTCPAPNAPQNCSIAASSDGTLLTVALKNAAGSDPTSSSPCYLAFRDATATTGSITYLAVTSALSISTNAAGATLGSENATAFRFWVPVFNNGGTPVMSLYNASTAASCVGIDTTTVKSSTAISGGATNPQVFYTPNGTTVTSKSITVVGYVEYDSTGLSTAGTYASGPDFIQVMGHDTPMPCTEIGFKASTFAAGSGSSSASTTYVASNVGDSITLRSAANLVRYGFTTTHYNNATAQECYLQMSRGSTQINQISSGGYASAGIALLSVHSSGYDKPNVAGAQSYTVYGKASGGTCVWNDSNGGGNIELHEIMGAMPIPVNDNINPGIVSKVG